MEHMFLQNVNGGNNAVVSQHRWERDKSPKSQTPKMYKKFPMAMPLGSVIGKLDWRK